MRVECHRDMQDSDLTWYRLAANGSKYLAQKIAQCDTTRSTRACVTKR